MDGQRRETLPSPLKIEPSAAEDPWGLSSLHRTMVTARTDVATSTLWCAAVRRRRGTLSCRSSITCSWRLTGSRARSCVRLALGDCKTGEGQAAFPASPGGFLRLRPPYRLTLSRSPGAGRSGTCRSCSTRCPPLVTSLPSPTWTAPQWQSLVASPTPPPALAGP